MRIGVIGGTFDPIHIGHLAAASEVAHRLHLDRVIFSPTGDSWHKGGPVRASAADRRCMVQLAVADQADFKVTGVDIERDGPTYTIDTLTDLQALRARDGEQASDEWFFITGADALAGLATWREPQRIAALAHLVGVTRPGHPLVRPNVPGVEVVLVEIPGLAISSSDIRARVAQGAPVRFLVPDAVDRYIAERGLYRAAAS